MEQSSSLAHPQPGNCPPRLSRAEHLEQGRCPQAGCRLCVEAVFALRCQLGVKRPGRDHGLVGSQQWVPSTEGKSPWCPLQACRSHSSEGVAGLWSPAMQWSPAPSSGMGATSCPATLGKSLESQERGKHRARLPKMSYSEGWRQQTLGWRSPKSLEPFGDPLQWGLWPG